MTRTRLTTAAGPWTFALALSLATPGMAADRPPEATWTFDDQTPGQAPKGFSPGEGRWEVAKDGANLVLAQAAANRGPVFNVILVDRAAVKDLDLTVRLKAREGRIDQGGGLVWRAKGHHDYYVARYNPLEDNFRVYKVVGGRRTMLQSASPKVDHQAWHTMRVTMVGAHIDCYLDGERLLSVDDRTFQGPGKVGLWTKADARTWFDDLTLVAPDAAAKGAGEGEAVGEAEGGAKGQPGEAK